MARVLLKLPTNYRPASNFNCDRMAEHRFSSGVERNRLRREGPAARPSIQKVSGGSCEIKVTTPAIACVAEVAKPAPPKLLITSLIHSGPRFVVQ